MDLSKKTTRVLMIWGGWDGHEPETCTAIMADELRAAGCEVHIRDHLDALLDTDLVATIDLFVPMWTMGEISLEQMAAVQALTARGCGIGGWHGGMCDAFRANVDWQYMTGGQFLCHPGGVRDYTVQISTPEDPLVAGLADFAMHSEQYYMLVDPRNEVLATTTFDGAHDPWVRGTVMPVCWKRQYDRSRVFYTALGHVAADFSVPEMREICRRGLLWAAHHEPSVG